MTTLARSLARADLVKTGQILDHLQRSRWARLALMDSGLSVPQLADLTGLAPSTVYRFLGLDSDDWNTKDPRTSTTAKIAQALGWTLEIRRPK